MERRLIMLDKEAEMRHWRKILKMKPEEVKRQLAEAEKEAKKEGYHSLEERLKFEEAEKEWLNPDC